VFGVYYSSFLRYTESACAQYSQIYPTHKSTKYTKNETEIAVPVMRIVIHQAIMVHKKTISNTNEIKQL